MTGVSVSCDKYSRMYGQHHVSVSRHVQQDILKVPHVSVSCDRYSRMYGQCHVSVCLDVQTVTRACVSHDRYSSTYQW